jgi:predicted nucleotide-binding protein
LTKARDAIAPLKSIRRGSPEFDKWHRNTEVAIANTFGENARHVKDFKDIHFGLIAWSTGTPDSAWDEAYQGGLGRSESVLQSMVEEVEEYWDDDAGGASQGDAPIVDVDKNTQDVFIVHGRDNGTKEMVARFMSVLGLNPIILHEQPNEGRTIIEKFERHANVGFAVALLTPDDVGALAESAGNLLPRARQNVVMELGYFMGRLGRQRVCALVKGGVEIPSDVAGVVYVPLDVNGGWRVSLVKELKAAGFDVDANKAL